jgi:hypothetical protein
VITINEEQLMSLNSMYELDLGAKDLVLRRDTMSHYGVYLCFTISEKSQGAIKNKK